MKKLLLIITLLISFVCKAQTLNYESITIADGIAYLNSDLTLVNGKVNRYYDNSQLRSVVNYKNGKEVGLKREWYNNGQLYIEGNYKDGYLDGLKKVWYGNGQLKKMGNYTDGFESGLHKGWYEDGNLRFQILYNIEKNSKKVESYYSNGNLRREEYEVQGRDIIEKEYFYNGQVRHIIKYAKNQPYTGIRVTDYSKMFYPNGNRLNVLYLNQFGYNGVQNWWYENGNLEKSENYKDNKRHGLQKYYLEDGSLYRTETYENGRLINHKNF